MVSTILLWVGPCLGSCSWALIVENVSKSSGAWQGLDLHGLYFSSCLWIPTLTSYCVCPPWWTTTHSAQVAFPHTLHHSARFPNKDINETYKSGNINQEWPQSLYMPEDQEACWKVCVLGLKRLLHLCNLNKMLAQTGLAGLGEIFKAPVLYDFPKSLHWSRGCVDTSFLQWVCESKEPQNKADTVQCQM